MDKAGLQGLFSTAYTRLIEVRESFQEKGAKYFSRPIAIGAVLALGSYYIVYRSSAESLRQVRSELEALQATIQYASDYQNLHGRLENLYARLPKVKEPSVWLLSEVRDSLRKEGIVPTSFSSPMETTVEGYHFVYIKVACRAHYKEIASWIARIERDSSFLFIQNLSMEKRGEPLGVNEINVTIGTVLPETQGVP